MLARCALALICFAALALFAAKTLRVETDFSAFLPPSATPEQRLLISQLRDGLVSRLMLVALHGADEKTLAQASRALAEKLGHAAEFDYALNGSLDQFAAQAEVLMRHRYALSPQINAPHFSAPALHAALVEQLDQLASPFGVLSKATLARDPTGEFLATLRQLDPGAMPALRRGVWFSGDGKRAFLIAQTRAPGFDSLRQAEAIAKVHGALAALYPQVAVTLTGPGVFAAESRRLIESDALRLSLCSALVILAMLLFVYRSALPVVLVLTPVAFGLLIGVLVVQALFGSVHAVTLGFSATLIGEAVDYPNYLLLNTARGETARRAAQRIGGTLLLAVLTTVASALALTLSSFTGLAQLGVLTMVGVMVAGLTTHRLLPWLLGDRVLEFRRLDVPTGANIARARWPGAIAATATLCGALWLGYMHPAWWETDLASISPVPPQMRELDSQLRREMGAPEVSFFVASRGASEAAALQAGEEILSVLQQWKQGGRIRSYDSPAWYLPAPATQAARLQALPDTAALQENLLVALRGLPFRPDAFTPFVQDIAAARMEPPMNRASYAGTPLGAKLNALVIELEGEWLVLTPLVGVNDPKLLAAELAAMPAGKSSLVDLAQISSQMVAGYRREALHQTGWGALLILLLLTVGLRSPRRTWRVTAPIAAALVLTVTLLVAGGQRLGVFHLVALLLVLGVGLNYALFFERPPADAAERARTRLSLVVCSVSTVATFGFLSLSATPVLHAIGSTVALGALLSLILSALWARPRISEMHV
ncbi:MAG: MMPL family transporter [Sulfuritalea sp.]|jgi:predicted exporter|nr:MMPL family transporter [Sulfuritalea sp.]